MSALQDKVIIVTGASSGIGKAEAETFAAEGAKVVLTDVNEAGVQKVAKKLGNTAIAQRHDVSIEADWNKVVANTVEAFGRVDGPSTTRASISPARLRQRLSKSSTNSLP